jgi:hypothetical protein
MIVGTMTTRDKVIVTIGSVLVAVLIVALTLAVVHRVASRQQKRAEYAYPQGRVDKWTAKDWGNWKVAHYDHPLNSEDGPGSPESRVKYWEIIADNLSKAGWSWGYISAVDSERRTIWIADAHRGWSRKNKARQIAAMMVKASSITSSDVSTYLRHG